MRHSLPICEGGGTVPENVIDASSLEVPKIRSLGGALSILIYWNVFARGKGLGLADL